MKRLWENYSLGIVYLAGWLLCWGLHLLGEYGESVYPHDDVPWLLEWFTTSFENLASEYHQVGAFVLLSKYFIFRESPQSKDGDDTMQRKIDAIQLKVDQLIERGKHLPVVTTEASGSDE